MEILRIPTHYRSQMEYMSDTDRWYILLSLMRLSEWEIIEIEKSMRWWVVISIWKEACQLEKKARKGKWEEYNEVEPIISYDIPWGCTLRVTPEIDPKSTQIKSNQPKSNQIVAMQPNEYIESIDFLKKQTLDSIEIPEYAENYKNDWIAFIAYWTEKWKTGKIRAEKEPTFEIKRRFATWMSRKKDQYQQKSKNSIVTF